MVAGPGRQPASLSGRWLVGPADSNLWGWIDRPTMNGPDGWLVWPRRTYGGRPDRPTINEPDGWSGRDKPMGVARPTNHEWLPRPTQGRSLARAGRAGRGGRRLLASAHGVGYLVGVGGGNRPGPRGDSGHAVPPTGSTSGRGEPDASPMTRPPPLGPGCMTGTRRQCRVGHGPTPVAPG
jgi:hypothetical protein